MNVIELYGRLASSPIRKTNANGEERIEFLLAVDRRKGEPSDFIPCRAYGKLIDIISKYTKNGARVIIVGKLRTWNYEVDEIKHFMFCVFIGTIKIIDFNNNEADRIEKANDSSAYEQDFSCEDTQEFDMDISDIITNGGVIDEH